MEEKYSALFTPWNIGNVEIKNRIVMTSMGGTCIFGWAEPYHFDEEAGKLLLTIAKNNAGLILPGIAPLRCMMGDKWLYKGQAKFDRLAEYMEEFHKTGAKMFVQLTAGFGRVMAITEMMEKLHTDKALGFLAKPIMNVDHLTMAPSAMPNRWSDKVPSRAMTTDEIHELIDAFAKTSKLCMDAGVDGIEVHAVHEGYLLDQFTMPYTNSRTDAYGGSFENRYRFPAEIVKAIKKSCGEDFPVSLRYSVVSKTKGFREGALPGEEYKEVGRDLEEGIKAAEFLQEAGYDMLNCDNGTYDAWYWNHPPMYMPLNCNFKEAEEIKKHVDIPVVVAGRMEADFSAEAIANGKIDAMGVARQFLADPEWITKLMENRENDIRPCICCHNGCFNMAHYNGVPNDQALSDSMGMCHCAVNPPSMNSKKYHITKTNNPKKIAIVGGGIGGMETARVAALRGHKPVIYEKRNELVGIFIEAASFDFKEKDKQLIEWYRKQMKDLGIEIHLNTEIKDLSEIDADKFVVATGTTPKRIPVKGFDKAIDAVAFLDGSAPVGENVAIIGGSLTGCEIALELYNKGKKPVIIEMKNDLIAARGVCMANSTYLRDFFKLNKVPVYLNAKLLEIDDKSVLITDENGNNVTINADSVIAAVGYNPAPLTKESSNIKLVGDCNGVGNLMKAIFCAWDVAMSL